MLIGVLIASLFRASAADASLPESEPKAERPVTRELLREIANSRLLTQTVTLTNEEPVALLWDVVLNWPSGEAEFGVLQLFSNVEQDNIFVPVPWKMLRFSPEAGRLQVAATKEQLRYAPEIPAGSAPDMATDAWASRIYQYWGEPAGQGSAGMSVGFDRGTATAFPVEQNYWPTVGAALLFCGGALLVGILLGRYVFQRRPS